MEDQEEPKSELKEVKDLFDKRQKLDRMIRKCFKLTKFYRHCDSIFHARIYGQRRSKRKTEKLSEGLKEDE